MPRTYIIDGRQLMVGRVAAITAKKLLLGKRVILTRCEEMRISGSLYRNHLKYREYRNKKVATNPRKRMYHETNPGQMVCKAIRGMIPRKTTRGRAALLRLTAFEGTPTIYQAKAKYSIPSAHANNRIMPGRKSCRLGDLATITGWKYDGVIAKMEANRKVRAEKYQSEKIEAIQSANVQRAKNFEKLTPAQKELLTSTGFAPVL